MFTTNELAILPSQKKSYASKDTAWRKNCVDGGEGMALMRNEGLRKSFHNRMTNYNLYSDILDQGDIERTCNPLGILGMTAPAKMQNYPILNPKIDLLVGESLKRRFDWKVRIVNDDAISEKEKDLKKMFSSMMESHMKKDVSEEQQAKDLKQFNTFANFEYQDLKERRATQILQYLFSHQKLAHKFSKGFKDALICAEEIYQVDIVGGEPVFERLNPLNVYTVRSGESPYIEDSDIILIRGYQSPGKIIDTYYDELTPGQIEQIENGFTSGSMSSAIDIGRKPDMPINMKSAMDLSILENDLDSGAMFDGNGNIIL